MIHPRDNGTVNLTQTDCWGLQALLKFNVVMLSPLNNQPIFPVGTVPFLRVKVNHALLRFASEPALSAVAIPLNYAECWVIDWVINVQSWQHADELIVQVLSVMAEHEMSGLHLKSADEGGDYEWKREDEQAFTDWAAKQQGEQEEGGG